MTTQGRSIGETKHWLRTAQTLTEALPFMQRYAGSTFVVKYGGHAMGDAELARIFARDITLMKMVGIHPVIVHGGGPQIARMLERLQVPSRHVDGLRVTDAATIEIVEMVLAGTINKEVVTSIGREGGTAVGLSGKDGRLIEAAPLTRTKHDPDSGETRNIDLGHVGEPTRVNPGVITAMQNAGVVPVIAPIGWGPDGQTLNINADTAAGAVASALDAARLLMLTDVPGVADGQGEVIPELTVDQTRALIGDGTIAGGMIPKVETCLQAVEAGVDASVIIDGRVPHCLLLETFTDRGVGTLLRGSGTAA